MDKDSQPMPSNEFDRLLNLAEYNIDFTDIESNFKELNKLAASIAGTDISLVNLIDTYTQWTVSSHGLEIKQMPRKESVCQYTITEGKMFEVSDLSLDPRFKDFSYVSGDLKLRYYCGVPLTTSEGFNIGALCVMHTEPHQLSGEKIEHLRILADEVVNRLKALKTIEKLKATVKESSYTQKKILHDVRGPIAGIVGLADIILDQGYDNDMEEVLEYMVLIKNGGNSVIQLANEALSAEVENELIPEGIFNLSILKEKLNQLYQPPAINKDISLTIVTTEETEFVQISKLNLLQITGNLISNSIKFTPPGGAIFVDLKLEVEDLVNLLHIRVTDTGIGLVQSQIDKILDGGGDTTVGTEGEEGFGFGLMMVKKLIDSTHGELKIYSTPGEATTFEVTLLQM
jgi:signal transduction histidine kinase